MSPDNNLKHTPSKNREASKERSQDSVFLLGTSDVSNFIVDNAPLLVVRMKPDGETLYVNKAACRISGHSAERILADSWTALCYPGEKLRQIEKLVEDLASEKDVVDYVTTITNKKGEDRTVQWHTTNLFDSDDRLFEIIGVGKDITEEKNKSLEAKEYANRLSVAQRVAQIGSWEIDIEANQIWWSEESYRIFGFEKSKEIITKDDFISAVFIEDREAVSNAFTESLVNKVPFDMNYRVSTPNQSIRHVHALGENFYDKEGKPERSVGTVRDITQEVIQASKLREAESAARELQEYNNHVVENSPMFIVGLYESGEVKHINKAGCEISGYSAEELKGKHFWDTLFPHKHQEQVTALFKQYRRNNVLKDYETTIVRKNGEQRIVSWSSVNRSTDRSTDGEIIGVGIDVTDLKQSQQDLEQLVHYDPLTGLPNRFNLSVRLELAIESAIKSGKTGALISINLDRFKNINESSGRATGDRLLNAVARRLSACLRQDEQNLRTQEWQ
ncbi:MAG: PAS domain S-box protein [Pseudomonadota bacterium]